MRMILVHGISQEGKSKDIILESWLNSLRATYSRAKAENPLERLSRIEAAFYGDKLGTLSAGQVENQTIPMGGSLAIDNYHEFAEDAIREIALRNGISEVKIEREALIEISPMGSGVHKVWIKAAARLIEEVSPFHGALALRVLRQAYAYLRDQNIHNEVNTLVRPLLEDDEPAIILSHSLGTIVALKLLREYAQNGKPRNTPLFLTLGSPLGIDSIRKNFSKPRGKPNNVQRWVNGADPDDFIALRNALTDETFGPGIENYSDIDNGDENPHSIVRYLSDSRIAKAIADSIP